MEEDIEQKIEEYSIDRYEEDIVVLENRETREIKNVMKELIPENANEGDVLIYKDGEYLLDEEKTKQIKEEIKKKYEDLWG